MELKLFFTKRFYYIILALLCNLFFAASRAQGFLKADGKRIINVKGENILLRGMGLGGWMLQEGHMGQ